MGGAAATYQMPVDPSAAIASNSQSQDALQAMNLGSADRFDATKAVKPINAHPEAVGQGIIQGAQSLVSSLGSAYTANAGGAAGKVGAAMKSRNLQDLPSQDEVNAAIGRNPSMSNWRSL